MSALPSDHFGCRVPCFLQTARSQTNSPRTPNKAASLGTSVQPAQSVVVPGANFFCSSGISTDTAAALLQTMADYEVRVTTSDVRGAGTDADVYITLEGSGGRSEEIRLFNSTDNFARNRTDVFNIKSVDVGSNMCLSVRLVSGARYHGWWASCCSNRFTAAAM